MFSSLKFKFIISFVILELIFLAIIVGINFQSLDNASDTLTKQKVEVTSSLLEELLKTPLIVFDLATVDDIVKNFTTIENVVGIEIVDSDGNGLSKSLNDKEICPELFKQTIEKKQRILRNKSQEYIFHSTDVNVDGQKIATIHFAYNTTKNFEQIESNKRLTYIMVAFASIVSFILAYFIGNNLGRSIEFLRNIANSVAKSEKIDIPYNSASKDEIGQLFYSMHLMQKMIYEKTQKLNQSLSIFSKNVIASHTDVNGKITYVSEAFCKISEYTKDELIGKTHRILRHPDMDEKVYKGLWQTIKSGKVWHGEIKNKKKYGGYYWTKAHIEPQIDENNKIIGFTSIRQDISAQKVKEEFMANMSHELRTPLNAIIGFTSILERKIDDQKHLEMLENIMNSSEALLVLINDILDLAKIQDSKFKIEPYTFHAYDELSKCVVNYISLMNKKNITLYTELDDSLQINLFGDWHRVNQIISNLISNAIKFTDENGDITISAVYEQESLIIKIRDNGIGMSQDVLEKVFRPFEQADGSTTRRYGGTGLGLTITNSLVELMQGSINVESEEGQGSTFTVIIPLTKSEGAETSQQAQNLLEEKREKLSGHILIVEDNKTNQLLIKMLLEELGVTFDVANDGLEALAVYDPQQHDIILMDENMPNMNGIEAMKALHEKYEEKCAPIIALTANAMKGDKEYFLSLGMDGYIAKPIDENELYREIEKFL